MIFKEIPKCFGYFAGDDGFVYSDWYRGSKGKTDSEKRSRLAGGKSSNGKYLHLRIKEDGELISRDIHVLIARAFLGPRPEGFTVSHLNGDSHDNRPENLIYESYSDNHKRKLLHGTHDRGINNSRAVFHENDIPRIFELYRSGLTQQEIADIYDVSRTSVLRVLNKQRYTGDLN